MKLRKRVILMLSVLLLVLLLFCTFFSRQMDLSLLPQVTIRYAEAVELPFSKTYVGETADRHLTWEIRAEEEVLFSKDVSIEAKSDGEIISISEWNSTKMGDTVQYETTLESTEETTVSVTMSTEHASFLNAFPETMVHKAGERTFLYFVEFQRGVFGDEYVIQEYPVEVLATDGTMTAIKSGEFGLASPVESADQPIRSGDVVQVPSWGE